MAASSISSGTYTSIITGEVGLTSKQALNPDRIRTVRARIEEVKTQVDSETVARLAEAVILKIAPEAGSETASSRFPTSRKIVATVIMFDIPAVEAYLRGKSSESADRMIALISKILETKKILEKSI